MVIVNKKLDDEILNIDKIICENIDLLSNHSTSRGLIAQNLLAQSRNLVEHIAVKIYAQGTDMDVDWNSIKEAGNFLKQDNKYLFIRNFHSFLQKSKSHYSPDNEGAERLLLKYYPYYIMLRSFMETEYHFPILQNLEMFPVDTDRVIEEYHEKVAKCIDKDRGENDLRAAQRLYVHKVIPFYVKAAVYYELVLTPALDNTSKFDRFVCYSKQLVPSHYAIKADIRFEKIVIHNKQMPVNIIVDYEVSIRPCELNNYARILGQQIKINTKHAEYIGMMSYLTRSGGSLLDIVEMPKPLYQEIKKEMFRRSKAHYLERLLDVSRQIVLEERPGENILRYLLNTLNNKVIKNQVHDEPNSKLSNLYLKWGCIPFDTMPFASSLIKHNPITAKLFESIDIEGHDHELLVRYLNANMENHSVLYTPVREVEQYTDNIDAKIQRFNSELYSGHYGRKVERFGQNLFVREAYRNTKVIIEKLQDYSKKGIRGYNDAMSTWLEEEDRIDSKEKEEILKSLFVSSRVALIYGAAGTGKTYIINHISNFFNNREKLFLANTNPAVDNLRRKVNAQNCKFMTIKKYLLTKNKKTEYDLLVIDECSMVSNKDMAELLNSIDCKLLLLAGDTYQIESITFGNWFSLASLYVPQYSKYELVNPYRTKEKHLLDFWEKVRNFDDDLAEYIVREHYSSNLNSTIFEPKDQDEIVLCLNYDGVYGINNINRFLQESNPNQAYRLGLWSFKVGDPVLFNESERFAPILYNNLKGTIVDVNEDDGCIWFSVEVEKALTELDIIDCDLDLLEPQTPGKSVIRFKVKKKSNSDEDNYSSDESVIPFQIAYAVSIHKAQGLEYQSVKIVITKDTDDLITHNIFYTAITRSKRYLTIYWSPETQQRVLDSFEKASYMRDATIFSAQSKIPMIK